MLAWTIKNKKSFRKTAILAVGFFVAVFLFLNIIPALAQIVVQGTDPQGPDMFGLEPIGQNIGLASTDIRLIVARIIRAVLGLLGIIAIVIMMYAGFTIMTAGGNEEKIIKGKKTMINGVIGIAIILSSFAIVQFLINMLGGGSQLGAAPDFVKKPYINTYSGSGSLGTIIKDHYPTRDQIDVKRNVSIIVTFDSAIDPSSIIENTNDTCWDETDTFATTTCNFKLIGENKVILKPYYGDCLTDVDNFSYALHCDKLITTSTEIYRSKEITGTEEDETVIKELVNAAAMTTYNGDGVAKTFVFKPLEALGDDVEDVWYTVDLRPSILKKIEPGDEVVSVFSGSYSGHYLWEFQTGTEFDFDPPHVIYVNPAVGELDVPKNRRVQIMFNEAINPLTVQGIFSTSSIFDNILINRPEQASTTDKIVSGEWKITNGYTAVEFVPDEECGFNSCGKLMYCLSVDCPEDNPEGNWDCSNNYEILIRTAQKIDGTDLFEAVPLTGVTDTADNALNGDWDVEGDIEVFDGRPTKGLNGNFKLINENEKVADNYFWSFEVLNKVDREAPFIENVTPELDQGGVGEKEPVIINFSKMMILSSLDDLDMTEFPDDSLDDNGDPLEDNQRNLYTDTPQGSCFLVGDNVEKDRRCLDSFWSIDISRVVDDKAQTELRHRVLGPNGYDFYYYPEIPSTVLDENQNCLYPGYGPDTDVAGADVECKISYNEFGNVLENKPGCVEVNIVSSTDTGCIQTTSPNTNGELTNDKWQSSTSTCLDFLEDESKDYENN